MYNTDQSISYLSESAAQSLPQPTNKTVRLPQPQVNQSINLQKNTVYQPYTERADIAPYMTSYTRPEKLHQKQIDVLGYAENKSYSSFKTGLLLSSLLLIGSVTGYSLEKTLAKKIKARGYGAIMGSLSAIGIYYSASKMLSSGYLEGAKAAGGFVIPMIPLFVSLYQKKPLDRTTSLIAAGVGALGSGYVIVSNLSN